MSAPTPPDSREQNQSTEFEQAGRQRRQSIVSEFFEFLKEDGKWWMLPILVVMGLVGFLMLVGNSAAPWIYALF